MTETEKKKKVVVVMGASGTGKSRLAIDVASLFSPGAVEIINADSMQVYRGLDVLTNKVPLHEQKGVPHHLLGTVDASAEFTARDFRNLAVPIIDDIVARGCIPVIVGGTNYYIQALVSPYLFDDVASEMVESSINDSKNSIKGFQSTRIDSEFISNYDRLKEVDAVAANRIHPNNIRKISRYLALYDSSCITPSELQARSFEKWGRADYLRYDCCFLWIDVSLPVLDRYVEQRVDSMMEHGLLNEVFNVYNPAADYTHGLRQAIGVREFEKFCSSYLLTTENGHQSFEKSIYCNSNSNSSRRDALIMANPSYAPEMDNKNQMLYNEAVDRLKANTKKLVRRQVRRLKRLQTFFGWNFHYVDATQALECKSETYWMSEVVEPCLSTMRAFLNTDSSSVLESTGIHGGDPRDLWTQFVCEACGNRVLRGAHEWEQHKLGRSHRKRMSHLRKKHGPNFAGVTSEPSSIQL